MMDLRYHLLSLTAVFLALTVGIVVGSSLGSSERQTQLVHSLQQDFHRVIEADRRVKQENQALRNRLAAREKATRQLIPLLLRDRASGLRLALVVFGGGLGSEAMGQLRQVVDQSGAEVTSTTRLPESPGALLTAPRPALANGASGVDDEERGVARAVVRAILTGDTEGRLAELSRTAGVLSEGKYDPPAPRLLVVWAPLPTAEGERDPFPAAERLAEASLVAAQEYGVRLVAAKTEQAMGTAFLSAAKRRGVTAIDRIDSAAGQIALVLALHGASSRLGSHSGGAEEMAGP
jgi:hypothetical protein